MVTRFDVIRPGLMGRVAKVGEVRVGDRIYVTRSAVDNDVRTVAEIVRRPREPVLYRFDRGPDLDERQLQRRPRGCRTPYGDGTVLLLDADAEVGELPDEFALLSRLDQWIARGGAARVEHTPGQYELSGQMLARMHQDAGPGMYGCYAVEPGSLLIQRVHGGGALDGDDPRPQLMIESRMWLLDAVAARLIEEAMGRAPAGAWLKAQRSLEVAARDIPYPLPIDDHELQAMVMLRGPA